MAGTSREHLSVPDEVVQQRLDAWYESGCSLKRAALKLGIGESTVKHSVTVAKKRGLSPTNLGIPRGPARDSETYAAQKGDAPDYDLTHPLPDGLVLKGASTRYNKGELDQQWVKSGPSGLEPENAVQLPDPKTITSISTYYNAQGRVGAQWVTQKPEDVAREALWIEFAKALAADLPKLEPVPEPAEKCSEALMNVIPFGDPHFGLYCWAEEVGNDFNLDIAKRDLCAAVDYLVSTAPKAKRTLIANCGDFFHADTMEGKTAKSGNILDMDTRLAKVIQVGVSAMLQAIHTGLTRSEVVEVINAQGNHDEVLALAMNVMLAVIYENNPRVIIHSAPTKRHYVRHGKCLVGVVHGDRTKDADLPGIMATERAEDWGLTKYRYYFRGHHHHDNRTEYNGCIVEQVRTLAPGDAYAVGGGWLSGRDMKCITMHAEYGEVARSTCSINMLRSMRLAA